MLRQTYRVFTYQTRESGTTPSGLSAVTLSFCRPRAPERACFPTQEFFARSAHSRFVFSRIRAAQVTLVCRSELRVRSLDSRLELRRLSAPRELAAAEAQLTYFPDSV